MKLLRVVCLAVAISAVSAASIGQEKPPAPPPQPAQQTPGGQSREAASAPTPAPPAAERGRVKDEEFIPTEELSADEEVTFPIDI